MITGSPSQDSGCQPPRKTTLDYLISHWRVLPPHIHESIITLVDAALIVEDARQKRTQAAMGNESLSTD